MTKFDSLKYAAIGFICLICPPIIVGIGIYYYCRYSDSQESAKADKKEGE